jgi:Sec-independent protein secretion pathway component TatC
MILMSLPMFFLYFICIGVAAIAEHGKERSGRAGVLAGSH